MCGAYIWSLLPIIFLDRAMNARARSLRLANFAMCFGLLFLCLPEVTFQVGPIARGVMGAIRLLIAASGGLMAILALVFQRQDRGTGSIRPALAITFCGLHALVGFLLIASSFQFPRQSALAAAPTAWTYQYPNTDIQIRFPSDQWREVPNNKGWKTFEHPTPQMSLSITEVHEIHNGKEFDRQLRLAHVQLTRAAKKPDNARQGTTAKGNVFGWMDSLEFLEGNKELYSVVIFVWCEKKNTALKMTFEGITDNPSYERRKADRDAFKRNAEFVLLSVE
jgi:hypothetical protein